MRKDELVCLMKKSFSPVCRNVLLYLLTPHFVLKMCEKSKNKKILCRGFDPARKVKKMNLVFLFFFFLLGFSCTLFLIYQRFVSLQRISKSTKTLTRTLSVVLESASSSNYSSFRLIQSSSCYCQYLRWSEKYLIFLLNDCE